ncbi:hypothetical protein [Yinghuangia seranimata]|uniref:hypothetical protein n=1 Tax=Yinghuangia seranimata TaxID=408067 RepID=UPI00248BAA73|nr:hypothetical protein [Yinghuangia seranimata]MDI2130035.1 hypothetical protein [Yinghuangia seranimata]
MTTEPDLRIHFLDHLIPRATPGRYRVEVMNTLTDADGDLDDEDRLPPSEETFEIRAVRFVLNEASVHALYPPPGSTASYTRTLPHITLNRSILPWERNLAGTRDADRPDARPPWLALLVFGENELPGDPAAVGATVLRTVAELRDPAEDGVEGPNLPSGGVSDAEAQSKCQTVDVPADLFTAVVPHHDELYYLAHVRKVTDAAQSRADGEVLEVGDYSVVNANRFPRTPGNYAVHLVSLEGFEGRLSGGLPPGTAAVRLCSLHSWTFTSSDGPAADPGALLENLVAPGAEDPEQLALRLPVDASADADAEDEYVRDRLSRGYTAVPHLTLSGERTYAWYRGPATPVGAHELPSDQEPGPHTTADHALIYEPEHGLFDVSYAAAWTLGRTIGLADPDYTTAVSRARRELANRATTLMAQAADPSRASADPDAPPALGALRELASSGFREHLSTGLKSRQLPDTAGRRTAPPTAPRAQLRSALSEERNLSLLRTTAERNAESIAAWQARLGLLQGVPFNHLVPDPRMLPSESLRMFRLDPGWLDALVAGAADVGVHTSIDTRLAPELNRATARRRGAAAAGGLLIHSELVPAWPDIRITAFLADGTVLTELRRAKPDTKILLVLWDGVPDKVVIREPGQGIHYGIDAGNRLGLRSLTADPPIGTPLETYYPATGSLFDLHLRPAAADGPAVLRMFGEGGLVPALARALGLDDLDPGQLALEFVNAPLQQEILSPGMAPADSPTRTESTR